MENQKNKIKKILNENKDIQNILSSSEFYFEKGRQVLKVFEQLSVTDEIKTYLINNKKNYTFLKDKFENSPDYKEIGRLIFTIISYCDSNAYKKSIYNEYEDKRVLALAFVRMNNWAEQLISYKFEYDNDITKLPIGSVRNAIAYLKKPSENFTMLSENHRRQVTERLFNKEYAFENFAKYFSDFFKEFKITPENADNLTAILSRICYLMKEEWLVEDAKEFVKDMNLEKTLDLLKYKKQIILQGPPGTGKTREAKQIAKALLNITEDKNLKNGEQFQIIQFHPSYSYEDFVRGIVAKPNSNGDGITYEAENKILVKIAERAWKNYKASSFGIDESDSISKDIWIDDKFNDFKSEIEKDVEEKEIPLSGNITIFKVDYDSFRYGKDWQTPSRINFTDFKNIIKAVLNGTYSISSQQIPKEISLHAHYRYTYYNALLKNFFDKYKYEEPVTKQDLKNFVLIIDEINRANLSSVLGELIYALEYRGEAVDSMYAVDRSNKITLPPNLYIIGTMNTADRSVGHIDYAVRRRFAFIDVLPRDLWSELKKNFNSEKFNAVADLFDKHLSQEFRKEEVQLGHSYFITENTDIQTRLQYEIKPILREYIKDGVLKESASDEIEKL